MKPQTPVPSPASTDRRLRGVGRSGSPGIASVILAALIATSTSADLTFLPLGDLPGGATNSAAYGVSSDGLVVVGSSSSSSGTTPFYWTETGGLNPLPILPGGTGAVAVAASANGQILVGSSHSTAGEQACFWSNGVITALGDLSGGSFHSVAKDVSDNGSMIVGYGTSSSGREAFRWINGVMTGLGDLAGGGFQSEAHATTPSGALIAGYGTAASQSIFTWDATSGMQNYYNGAWAHDLSADGSQLVGHLNSSYVIPGIITIHYRRAARWNGGALSAIGPDSTGQQVDSTFHGVSHDGSIAVGTFKNSSGLPFAVSHDSINGIRNLKTALENDGVNMTGWELTSATAISADGSVIVGYGTNPGGQQEAWVIKGYGLNLQLRWVGNNAHWPANDDLTSSDDLWMNIDSMDQGVGVTGVVVYSTDKGATWTNAPLIEGTPGPDYDHWYQNLGSFPAGTTIRYSLAVEDATGYQLWDNNQGRDYYAVVSPGYLGPVEWIGNDGANGTVAHSVSNRPLAMTPSLTLNNAGFDAAHLLAEDLQPDYSYTLEMSSTLSTWSNVSAFTAMATSTDLPADNAADAAYYRLAAASTASYVVITREVWPQDSGKTAKIGYRINGGDWQAREMTYAGQLGNNDVWQRLIGPVGSGSSIEYFIEVISASNGGLSHFDNNDNNNYTFVVP